MADYIGWLYAVTKR